MRPPFVVPDSAYPRCLHCNEPVKESSRMLLHEITGFEHDRSQGGTSHVIARARTERIACPECAEKIRKGEPPEQGGLF
jgi:hypothetical protein